MRKSRRSFNFISVIICLVLLGSLLTGCKSASDNIPDLVELRADGTLKTVMTAVFDKDYYDLDELSENLKLLVDDYNDTIDGFQIEVTSITKSEDNMVEVDMYYRTDEDYAAFNNVVFNETLLSKALADGSINGDVTLAGLGESGISSVADIAASKTRYHVLIFNEPISVKVPGKVAYISDSLHMDEDGWISLKEIPEGSIVLPANLYIIYK